MTYDESLSADLWTIFRRSPDGDLGTGLEQCVTADLRARLCAAIDVHGFLRVGALPAAEYARRRAALRLF